MNAAGELRRPRLRVSGRVAFALLLTLVGACGENPRPTRAPFVALEVDPAVAIPGATECARLLAAGVGEVVVPAGQLGWEGSRPRILPVPLARVEQRMPTLLVVRGSWAAVEESAGATAQAWWPVLGELESAALEAGLAPIGFAFELDAGGDEAGLAQVLSRLRKKLAADRFIAVAVAPERADVEGAKELARAVDFVFADVWGHPPTGVEEPHRWDLEKHVRPAVAALERLGRPYALGAYTIGEVTRVTASGREAVPDVRIEAVLPVPGKRFEPESLLEGLGRQVQQWRFDAPTWIGTTRFERGDSIRFVWPATANLEEFLGKSAEWGSPLRVGTILRRYGGARETMALGIENLAAAVEPGAAAPDLAYALEWLPSAGGRRRLRVALENRNHEVTDLARVDANFLELRFEGSIVARVDGGEFDAWDQLYRGEESRTVRALREADTLRLHVERIGPRRRIVSGVIEIRSPGSAAPAVSGRLNFYLPGGRVLETRARPLQALSLDQLSSFGEIGVGE